MANVKDWVRYPPKEPLVSFKAILRDWNDKFAEGKFLNHKRDHVVDYVRDAGTIVDAVNRAVISKTADGKMHNHQVKVRMSCRIAYGMNILNLAKERSCPQAFHELFKLCSDAQLWGIGEMTVFDVAMRLSYWFRLPVEHLYLHAGCLDGWMEIDRLTHRRGRAYWKHVGVVRKWEWPKEFRHLPGDEFEDICCTYRHFMKDMDNARQT